MVNTKELYTFFEEMTSQGISGFAPEHVIDVVDINKPEEDDNDD
jgi:hypothetical protein